MAGSSSRPSKRIGGVRPVADQVSVVCVFTIIMWVCALLLFRIIDQCNQNVMADSTSSDDFVSSPVVVVPPAQPDPPLDDSDNGPADEEVALFPDTYHLSNVNSVGGFAATIT
nr:hypothetical protein Iba_chr04aCG21080 [Ipomoea batatas]